MKKPITEKRTTQKHFLGELQALGYRYVSAEELGREDTKEVLLLNELRERIRLINPDIDEDDVEAAIKKLLIEPSTFEGGVKTLDYIKEGVPIQTKKGLRFVQLIDYKDLNNSYIITDEFEVKGPNKNNFLDVVIFVNGIPLVNIETKNLTGDWEDALKDIKAYQQEIPELYRFIQIGIAAAYQVRYFATGPGIQKTSVNIWKSDEKEELYAILDLLKKDTLLDVVRFFIYYKKGYEYGKVVPRHMQYRAVNKMYERALNYIKGKSKTQSGLIWHWQGSGKTLTMIFAAYKMLYSKDFDYPSIFIVVDRDDLQSQMERELSGILVPSVKVKRIESIKDLINTIKEDKRGLFLTLIHKFREKSFEEFLRADLSLERKNIILFFDEAHRTQYGQLASTARKVLKNALMFGFTGTPSMTKERNTFIKFGNIPQGELWLDKYFIKESIEDGFTIPIVFKTVYKDKILLDEKVKEAINQFMESELDDLDDIQREKIKEKTAKRLSKSALILENEDLIRILVKDILKRLKIVQKGPLLNGFKAMIVAPTRKACVLFKAELDKYFDPYETEIVMTYNEREDDSLIKNYLSSLRQRYGRPEWRQINAEIREKFKKENENPKILIVTNMLLQGFDAPILQTMFLYKLLKGHTLLQTIARTNRPYLKQIPGGKVENIKPHGLVIDYLGLLKRFKEAIANYGALDKEQTRQAIEAAFDSNDYINETKALMDALLREIGAQHLPLETKELISISSKIREDENLKASFKKKALNILNRVDMLYTDLKDDVEFMKKYFWLQQFYIFMLKVEAKSDAELESYFLQNHQKIINAIKAQLKLKEINLEFPEIILREEKFFEPTSKIPPEERILNYLVQTNKHKTRIPQFDKLSWDLIEQIEKIIQEWNEEREGTEEALEEITELLNELERRNKERQKAKEEGRELEWDLTVFFESENIQNAKSLAKRISDEVKELLFSGWVLKRSSFNEVSRKLRFILLEEFKDKLKEDYSFKSEVDRIYERVLGILRTRGE